ncbi:enolase 4-like isoform X2 [Dreissena polymorpha]|nr:enolase 4-like isoform X2 [Dreissena polymorpha]
MSSQDSTIIMAKEARALYELKEKAAKYYRENGVPQKMEEIMNSMFYDNPVDIYGHLADYFQSFAKSPSITQIKARKALDGKGQTTLQTDVFCTVNNKSKMMSSTVSSSVNPSLPETTKPEEMEEEANEREKNVQAALQIINSELCARLKDREPNNQEELDKIVCGYIEELKEAEEERLAREAEDNAAGEAVDPDGKTPGSGAAKSEKPKSGKGKGGKGGPPVVIVPDEPKEKLVEGSACVSAVSQALCVAGACAMGTELYEYIAQLRFGQAPKQYRMPLPMVTIFQSGRSAPGKANAIKEYMVVPAPGKPLSESIPKIVAVYNDIIKAIMGKNGIQIKNVTDIGALMMPFDRPEQGLDMILESMGRLGFTPGEDLYLALNLAGHEYFDYEKGKYEVVTGQQKVAEDLVEYWADILTRYPAIIAIIDPMRKQEDRQWMLLCERLSEKCYILGDRVWHRPGLLKDEEPKDTFKSSGTVYRLEQMNTVTDILQCAQLMEGENNITVLSTNIGETSDTFLADMAVGMSAHFLKLGAPCRGERVSKLNRLLAIEQTLQDGGQVSLQSEFVFPAIKIPPPPETDNAEPEEVPTPKETPKKK